MNAPTLLLGLGGTGSKIVENVSNLASPEQRKHLGFAVFDTDVNELEGIRKRNPQIKTIQTSTRLKVGQYLNLDKHARDTWFPVNAILNSKTLTDGAGQVRSVSRLALETVIRAGKLEPLHDAIHSLYKVEEDKVEQALRVIIVSSLAGGTGSGLILPVAMYVRNYLETHFKSSANITRGFFILPEVFFSVIPSPVEQNSLKANAYATLRELDAFLMKGDNTLHPKYKDSVKIDFPRVASTGYEQYNIRPYDFCFLFDAQNADGSKLNSFEQYLNHAANCIYSQSIGPMNKRSNSSEDNTIRKLAKERGRNRYAGAGASMLIYPFEDIKTFIALKWAKECVSEQWLMYDQMFKQLCVENEKKKNEGIPVQNPDSATHYMDTVETLEKQGDAFSRAIIKSCCKYKENGVTKESDNWTSYIQALHNKINEDMDSGLGDIDSVRTEIKNKFGDLSNEWNEYATLYQEIVEYKEMNDAFVDEKAPTIAYAMFNSPQEYKSSVTSPYQIEHYLIGSDNKFIHPNAVRYLLNKINVELKKMLQLEEMNVKNARIYFDTFEEKSLRVSDSDEEGSVGLIMEQDQKVNVFEKLKKSANADQEEIRAKLRDYMKKVEQYRKDYVLERVLREGVNHVDALIRSFENFYSTFGAKVSAIDDRISDIYKKYTPRDGMTARYVCASKYCLDKIYKQTSYTGGSITIDSKLAKEIYDRVSKYALMKDRPSANRYFSTLFDEGILGYFEYLVMDKYGTLIDLDVFDAIEKEGEYTVHDYIKKEQEKDPKAEFDENEEVEQFVIKTIDNVRALSCPFIERPLDETTQEIYSCTYNDMLDPRDDSPKSNLIKAKLKDKGGEPDEDIPKNMIMFYQSFYGLRANDLSKFAPPEKSETYDRRGGEYFKSYYELIEGINPEPQKSKEISPHIDRWWHLVSKMPDLDENNQAKLEHRNYAAFFWGVLGSYIKLYDVGNSLKVYKLNHDELGMDNSDLVVSNGTPCDKFYEVLDAVSIYPELVSSILKKIEEDTIEDLNEDRDIEDGILYSYLNEFKLSEPGIGLKLVPISSIFSIPLLMKKSTTPDIYFEDDVIGILKAEIIEIEKYLSHFCTSKELPEVMRDIIKKQFDLFLNDMKLEYEADNNIYGESLFDRTCSVLKNTYRDLGLKQDARDIRNTLEKLRK